MNNICTEMNDSPGKGNEINLKQPAVLVLSAMAETGLVSLPSLFTAVLLQANNGLSSDQASAILPSNFEEVATGVLKVLNNVACLDITLLQCMLARSDLKMEFFHLLSSLLNHCMHKWRVPNDQDVESIVTAKCKDKLLDLYNKRSISELVEVVCVTVGAREQLPPSTVGRSSIYIIIRRDNKLYVGQYLEIPMAPVSCLQDEPTWRHCIHMTFTAPALLEVVKASSYRRHTTMAWCRQPSPASSQPCTTRSTTSATATFSSTAVVILPEQTMKLLRACTTACSCKKS
ncbi:uncharacterized protein [Triticum aestivum]|uniref:uncharacterized protein isoform X1 n=1 Tax=Triticum aestivum TaxID=4565 RepID=UPI001D023B7C|nr:uncharacterized protein LOC123062107 isoform X1 [Triticum aestivum]XP_044341387.1 uncharacterized protein LOC123062107 isoform X1 [Triticum aestivum]XP_044341388.1 uncharacterized protein LOC123062107 isoform X1 [Triticum aestivum]XP_044341389.1 uncharacterized protein LOC123062107 isoform X1 [Triticum aestivum]XP_044341390.1 uncharacterized protein LOC123062107 isoform X1 [Triticum aestivum]XP_044341391.1 uncharacterized protein LOC123062107 isoform X1 [Triticum aestivum]